ncbi:MAG: deoxyribose-phosphate aldolase [Chloroflexales bacterium]|nr:deoxyribose-phosphate aldolase [Chloroflexales bacterium]
MTDDLIEQIAQVIEKIPGLPAASRVDRAHTPSSLPSADQLASFIDHTQLKPEATPAQIEQLCAEARQYGFASACVNPSYVSLCVRLLAGSNIAVCTVAGFPLGATTTAAKVFETRQAIEQGTREVDMVIAIGRLKATDHAYVYDDIAQVVAVCHAGRAICKVIIETALLTDAEKIAACMLAARAKADFVKTSTGFAGGGATPEDVALMRRVVGPALGVKAAGGIRNRAAAQAMIAAGATRIGASAGIAIVSEGQERSSTNAEASPDGY